MIQGLIVSGYEPGAKLTFGALVMQTVALPLLNILLIQKWSLAQATLYMIFICIIWNEYKACTEL